MGGKASGVVVVCLLVIGLALGGLVTIPAGTESKGPVPCPGVTSWEGSQTLGSGRPEPMNPRPGGEGAKTFGTAGVHDAAVGLDVTSDGGAVVLIRTHTAGGATVLKLDGEGTVMWQQRFSHPVGLDGDIQQTLDGGYIAALDADAPGRPILVYRLDAVGNILWQGLYDGPGNSRVYSIAETSDGGFLTAGGGFAPDGP